MNLGTLKQKILGSLPPDLRPLMEMYFDTYEDAVTDMMAADMLRECNVLGQHHFNRIHINDLRSWALTKQTKLRNKMQGVR